MTEKSLIDEKFSDIEYNLKAIREDIAEAAIKSGRRPEDIDFMAVTKTGMLEPRNAVEALILILAIGYPELMLIPMATTIRIVVMTVTLIPIGILAAMGIDGDSLFQYAGHIICYLAHRRKLHLRRVGYKYDQRQLRKKKSRKKKA